MLILQIMYFEAYCKLTVIYANIEKMSLDWFIIKTITSRLKIGADKSFEIIHISDTHITFADERNEERKIALAKDRANCFPEAQKVLTEACRTAKERNAVIMHTGDLIDFVSFANFDAVKKLTDENDLFMAAGNHEFSHYLGEAKEDAAYRNLSLDMVQRSFRNNIRMASRIINGINFVALDNGYYLFEPEQLDFLKAEVQKGLPVVLLIHTPLFAQELYDICMQKWDNAYLAGVPEELMQCYPPDRYEQQKADSTTLETIKYISEQKNIKAILTGHLHFTYEGLFEGKIPQLINGCTDIRIIEIC